MPTLADIIYNQIEMVSRFGDNISFLSLLGLLLALYLYKKGHVREIPVLLLSYLSYPLSLILKGIFQMQRPESAQVLITFPVDGYGFPSSHVVFYTAFWGVVIYLSYKLTKLDPLIRHISRWLGIYFISFIGLSRIFIGAHFLKDVIGGYIFGILYLFLLIYLDKKYLHNKVR